MAEGVLLYLRKAFELIDEISWVNALDKGIFILQACDEYPRNTDCKYNNLEGKQASFI